MSTIGNPDIIDTKAEITDAETYYNENIITGNDFKSKVDEISSTMKECSIRDLKLMFMKAMEARNAPQDMKNFEPMCASNIDLFIRQIGNTVSSFSYDDLFAFHKYVMNLVSKTVALKETKKV